MILTQDPKPGRASSLCNRAGLPEVTLRDLGESIGDLPPGPATQAEVSGCRADEAALSRNVLNRDTLIRLLVQRRLAGRV